MDNLFNGYFLKKTLWQLCRYCSILKLFLSLSLSNIKTQLSDAVISLLNKSREPESIVEAWWKITCMCCSENTYLAYSNRFSICAFNIEFSYGIGLSINEENSTLTFCFLANTCPKIAVIFNNNWIALALLVFLL